MLRHEDALDADGVAAGGPHAGGEPHVVDLDLRGRHQHEPGDQLGAGLERVRHHPVRVVHGGGPLPSPVDHEPALDGRDLTGRGQRRRGQRHLTTGEQLGPGVVGELGEEPRVLDQERDRPGRRRTAVGEQPGALAERVETEAVASQRRRHHRPEQVRVVHCLDRLRRHPAERLGLLGPGREPESQRAAPAQEDVVVESGVHRRTIGKLCPAPRRKLASMSIRDKAVRHHGDSQPGTCSPPTGRHRSVLPHVPTRRRVRPDP